MELWTHENAVFSSSCQYTRSVAHLLSWPHNTLLCVIICTGVYSHIYKYVNIWYVVCSTHNACAHTSRIKPNQHNRVTTHR